MKNLQLLLAIAPILASFNSYSQEFSVSKYLEMAREQSIQELKKDDIILPKPYLGSPATYKINTNLNGDLTPKSNKKTTLTGMTIEELSHLTGPKRTGFDSAPESVSGTELLDAKRNGQKIFQRGVTNIKKPRK
jgi:hypothetical protein